MAQTRPRFGGGKIMERTTTEKFSLPIVLERKTQNTSSMEQGLYIQACEPNVLRKEEEDADKEETETEELLGHEENVNDIISPHSQFECQAFSEEEVKTFQLKEVSLVDGKGCEDSLCENGESRAHSVDLPKILIQNDNELTNQALDDGKCISGISYGHDIKADVKQLMSVLQSLGIHTKIKPYVRSAPASADERNHAEKDGMAHERISRHVRPIDLGTTSSLKKRQDSQILGDDEKNDCYSFSYCKNLFLKDRQDHYYLIIAEESAVVDFKVLKKQLNAARNLSFADVTATENILGEKSGGINPFVAMRKSAHDVRFVLHQSLLKAKNSRTLLAFHPLDSRLQIEITVLELIAFLEYFDKQLEILPSDMSNSTVCECLTSNSDKAMKVTDVTIECKQSKNKPRFIGTNAGSSPVLKIKQDSSLLNPTVNGKPLWKVHMRKGKLKSFLKATNDDCTPDTKTNKSNASVEEFNETEIKTLCDSSLTNQLMTNYQTEKGKFDDAVPKSKTQNNEFYMEAKSANGKIEQSNQHLNLPDTANPSTLPEITQFYSNLSDLCIEFQDLDIHMSTTRDIGPSIGCKCFFLKDRRLNFYLIITHEYYELDHGRLKKALKPKKKLDHAEPAEILENLGVQPSRITPFSCTTDRAISKNVMVFMTEKILPPEVILCIQHPFAEGRRLVMKSGELQRYLSTFKSSIDKVEEKAWPEKYNRIFTQFNDQSYTLTFASQAATSTSVQNHNAPTDIPSSAFESKMQTVFFDENKEKIYSSDTEENRAPAIRSSKSALRNVCKILSNAFLILAGRDTRLTSSSLVENIDDTSNGQKTPGSSVDPPAKDTRKEGHDILSFQESQTVWGKTEKVTCGKETTTREDSSTTENIKVGEYDSTLTDRQLNRHCCKPCQDKHSNMGDTSLTVEDIIQHLRKIAVDFTYTDSTAGSYVGDELDLRLQYHRRKQMLKSQENPIEMENNSEAMPHDMPNGDDHKKLNDHDNIEICSTAYVHDNNNHYIIVGGESDYLTKRRLRRLFHLKGGLQMGGEITSGLTTTPFSLVLSLKDRTNQKNPPPKIYVILFTSLYLDPETQCVFHLDQKGSTLKMTSSQLECFITKSGMECWYVP